MMAGEGKEGVALSTRPAERPQVEIFHALAHGVEDIVDSDGHLTEHIECCTCKYDLFALTLVQQCPECGAPVRMSVRGNTLAASPPEWLAWMGQSMRISGMALMPVPLMCVANWIWTGRLWWALMAALLLAHAISALMAMRNERGQQGVPRTLAVGWIAMAALIVTVVLCTVLGLTSRGELATAVFVTACVLPGGLTIYCRWAAGIILRAPLPELSDSLKRRPIIFCLTTGLLMAAGIAGARHGGMCLVVMLLLPVWFGYLWLIAYNLIYAGELLIALARDAAENRIKSEFRVNDLRTPEAQCTNTNWAVRDSNP